MNSIINRGVVMLGLIALASCVKNDKIFELLRGKYKDDVIQGAIEAGRTKDTIFIQELLNKAADWRRSTNVNFYGVTVYQAKMKALEQIFDQSPPNAINDKPDSAIIKFYSDLARQAHRFK